MNDIRETVTPGQFSAPTVQESVPAMACTYCTQSNPLTLAVCLTCGKWFCNSIRSKLGSHIVYHLGKSRHRGVRLHKGSPLEDITLECYNCSAKNVFNLGFIMATEERTAVLLCRSCLMNPNIRHVNWDAQMWENIVKEKSFLPWILESPNAAEFYNPEPSQLCLLEEAWRKNPDATLSTMSEMIEVHDLNAVKLRYESGEDYLSTFLALIQLESDHTRMSKTNLNQKGVNIEWVKNVKNYLAVFTVNIPEEDFLWTVSDELQISTHLSDTSEFSDKGTIIRIEDGSVTLQMRGKSVPTHITSGYTVEYVGIEIPFQRMIKAVERFCNGRGRFVSKDLFDELLGLTEFGSHYFPTKIPSDLSVPGLPSLNHPQIQAIHNCLTYPLTIIQGPPGTGKTVTSASIVYHMARVFKEQVLVCAPSNIAVDHLAAKIEKTGLKVIRVLAKKQEKFSEAVKGFLLHKVIMLLPGEFRQLAKLQELQNATGELSLSDEATYRRLKEKAEKLVLKNADVICCTCSCSGDSRLNSMTFKHVLIDEATQATEPDCIVPIVRGCNHLVLVGDHKQLGPIILDTRAKAAGFGKSLYERCIKMKYRPVVLNVQYRMHPKLSLFPSEAFYNGALQNGVTEAMRYRADIPFPFPNPSIPLLFLSCEGVEEVSGSGTSYLNRKEAILCDSVVSQLIELGAAPSSIGVISPYEGQHHILTEYISSKAKSMSNEGTKLQVEIENVDGFQGREKDYIILSCVRSNDNLGIGFVKDGRRLNVSLTRAKYGLIIIGNARVLVRDRLWHHLLYHCQKYNCLVEGTLSEQSKLTFVVPEPPPLVNTTDYEMAIESNFRDDDKYKMNALLTSMTALKTEPNPSSTTWDIPSPPDGSEDDESLMDLPFDEAP